MMFGYHALRRRATDELQRTHGRPRTRARASYPAGPERLEPRRLLSVAYTVTDLSVLAPQGDFIGNAINDSGQVVGSASEADKHTYPFLYSGGTMHDLGSFWPSGISGAGTAAAINNNGDIAGQASGPNGVHAFLYKNGALQDLGSLDPPPAGYNFSFAWALNQSDQVVGYSTANAHPQHHAFLYSSGMLQDLGTPFGGSYSEATGINDSGQIIGFSQAPDRSHGFEYSDGTFLDLGQLADAQGGVEPLAMNNAGQIVGFSASRAFLYSGGTMQDLGLLSGFNVMQANAINAGGAIVGTAGGGLSYGHAFLYSGGSMMDLNNLVPSLSGWALTDAKGINASGQIVCDGVNTQATGTPITHSFLLTPSQLTVGSPSYDWQHLPQTLSFTFSADVSASLTRTTLQVQNLSTGAAIQASQLVYDAATNTATFQFPSVFPDGHYRATLPASAFSDSSGRHLATDFSYGFFALAGDVNHDGQVDFTDLVTLARNYGRNGTFAQGDLNYDGKINFADLVLLARNYGHVIPPAKAAAQSELLSPLLGLDDPTGALRPKARHRNHA